MPPQDPQQSAFDWDVVPDSKKPTSVSQGPQVPSAKPAASQDFDWNSVPSSTPQETPGAYLGPERQPGELRFQRTMNTIKYGPAKGDTGFGANALRAVGYRGTERGAPEGMGGTMPISGAIEGIPELVHGLGEAGKIYTQPPSQQSWPEIKHTANDLFRGGLHTLGGLLPFGAPEALPGVVPGLAVGGTVGSTASKATQLAGGDPEAQELAGNVAGVGAIGAGEPVGRLIESNAPRAAKVAGYTASAYRMAKDVAAGRPVNPADILIASKTVTEPVERGLKGVGSLIRNADISNFLHAGTLPADRTNTAPGRALRPFMGMRPEVPPPEPRQLERGPIYGERGEPEQGPIAPAAQEQLARDPRTGRMRKSYQTAPAAGPTVYNPPTVPGTPELPPQAPPNAAGTVEQGPFRVERRVAPPNTPPPLVERRQAPTVPGRITPNPEGQYTPGEEANYPVDPYAAAPGGETTPPPRVIIPNPRGKLETDLRLYPVRDDGPPATQQELIQAYEDAARKDPDPQVQANLEQLKKTQLVGEEQPGWKQLPDGSWVPEGSVKEAEPLTSGKPNDIINNEARQNMPENPSRRSFLKLGAKALGATAMPQGVAGKLIEAATGIPAPEAATGITSHATGIISKIAPALIQNSFGEMDPRMWNVMGISPEDLTSGRITREQAQKAFDNLKTFDDNPENSEMTEDDAGDYNIGNPMSGLNILEGIFRSKNYDEAVNFLHNDDDWDYVQGGEDVPHEFLNPTQIEQTRLDALYEKATSAPEFKAIERELRGKYKDIGHLNYNPETGKYMIRRYPEQDPVTKRWTANDEEFNSLDDIKEKMLTEAVKPSEEKPLIDNKDFRTKEDIREDKAMQQEFRKKSEKMFPWARGEEKPEPSKPGDISRRGFLKGIGKVVAGAALPKGGILGQLLKAVTPETAANPPIALSKAVASAVLPQYVEWLNHWNHDAYGLDPASDFKPEDFDPEKSQYGSFDILKTQKQGNNTLMEISAGTGDEGGPARLFVEMDPEGKLIRMGQEFDGNYSTVWDLGKLLLDNSHRGASPETERWLDNIHNQEQAAFDEDDESLYDDDYEPKTNLSIPGENENIPERPNYFEKINESNRKASEEYEARKAAEAKPEEEKPLIDNKDFRTKEDIREDKAMQQEFREKSEKMFPWARGEGEPPEEPEPAKVGPEEEPDFSHKELEALYGKDFPKEERGPGKVLSWLSNLSEDKGDITVQFNNGETETFTLPRNIYDDLRSLYRRRPIPEKIIDQMRDAHNQYAGENEEDLDQPLPPMDEEPPEEPEPARGDLSDDEMKEVQELRKSDVDNFTGRLQDELGNHWDLKPTGELANGTPKYDLTRNGSAVQELNHDELYDPQTLLETMKLRFPQDAYSSFTPELREKANKIFRNVVTSDTHGDSHALLQELSKHMIVQGGDPEKLASVLGRLQKVEYKPNLEGGAAGLHWPGSRRIELDPQYEGSAAGKGYAFHELGHSAQESWESGKTKIAGMHYGEVLAEFQAARQAAADFLGIDPNEFDYKGTHFKRLNTGSRFFTEDTDYKHEVKATSTYSLANEHEWFAEHFRTYFESPEARDGMSRNLPGTYNFIHTLVGRK